MRGKFITIEGGDGAGKSSAVTWLQEELKDIPIVFTREPGGTESAEEMRDTLVRKRDEDLDVLTQILLFEASRREHVTKKIIPSLESGKHVVSDRFSGSTYGYQVLGGNGEQYTDLYNYVDEAARGGLNPDLVIFLDVDPKKGIARKRDSGDELNAFDEKELEFYVKVREGIKSYTQNQPHVVIDANQEQQEVRDEIKRAILSCIE